MPKINNGFNKAEYDQAYHKKNYKNVSVVFKLGEAEELEQAAEASGLTKSAYIKQAVFEKIDRDSKNK